MNNRRITPTPSIEKDKERQRMMQGVENEGRSSRGSSAQRERPPQPQSQPPSRDSSLPPESKESPREAVLDHKAEEKLERQTVTIYDEYLATLSTVDDVAQELRQLYPEDKMGDFVGKALQLSFEKKAGAQKATGQLFSALMDKNLFGRDVLVEQLCFVYECADDIAIDVPKVWELQAQVVVPILATERIDFSHFKAACGPVLNSSTASKLLVPVLNFLVKEKEVAFVRRLWDSSNVSLKDFLPSQVTVDAFVKDNSLEYLTGAPPEYQPSMDQVQEQMLRLVQADQPCDTIFNYISSNVGEKVEDLQFIRALTITICEACVVGNSLKSDKFKEYEKLIQRFVDNKEDRELACLSSVHILMVRLQHPQGLIKNIFNYLLDNGLVSCESFLKWRDDDQEVLESKGVSLMSLTSFFKALEEADTEDEAS